MDPSQTSNNIAPMEEVLYEVKKVIVGQDILLERLIVALLALNQGVIGQAGYVSLVTMSLVTTLIVPLVLRNWLYRT